jgi:putative sigma-54 modulation protein
LCFPFLFSPQVTPILYYPLFSEKENKIVELKVLVPGDDFIVKKQSKTFEEATDLAIESLERLLLKRKEKLKAHA